MSYSGRNRRNRPIRAVSAPPLASSGAPRSFATGCLGWRPPVTRERGAARGQFSRSPPLSSIRARDEQPCSAGTTVAGGCSAGKPGGGPPRLPRGAVSRELPPKSEAVIAAAAQRLAAIGGTGRHDFRAGCGGRLSGSTGRPTPALLHPFPLAQVAPRAAAVPRRRGRSVAESKRGRTVTTSALR